MLDACRHFFKPDEVKEYLDLLALHKINRFHWHLTDDQGWRIEIKKYPELTTVGSVREKDLLTNVLDTVRKFDENPYGGFYTPVSYTHLDVYKRQNEDSSEYIQSGNRCSHA